MRYINIFINNVYKIKVDIINELVIINGKEKKINKEKISNLKRIICTWKSSTIETNIIDDRKLRIEIGLDNTIDIISIDGVMPNNFYQLEEWINDLYE